MLETEFHGRQASEAATIGPIWLKEERSKVEKRRGDPSEGKTKRATDTMDLGKRWQKYDSSPLTSVLASLLLGRILR